MYTLISCDDDKLISFELEGEETEINIALGQISPAAQQGEAFKMNVTLPNSFQSESTVTVEVQNPDGNTSTGSLDFEPGETTGVVSVSVPNLSGNVPFEGMNSSVFKVKGFVVEESDEGGDNELIRFITTSNTIEVPLFANYLSTSNDVSILFDWQQSANVDMDINIFDGNGDETSFGGASGSRYEGFSFGDGIADDTYSLRYAIFAIADGSIGDDILYKLFVRDNEGELYMFEGIIENIELVNFDEANALLNITKTTDLSDPLRPVVSYEISGI